MKTLPINQLNKRIVTPLKKVAPFVASAMLATTAFVATAKTENTNTENTKSVPAAVALATFMPMAIIRRKEGEEKTFNPNLYDAKMQALLKKRHSITPENYQVVKAICENDKIDVETAPKCIAIVNPDEDLVNRYIKIINSNHIKNEKLPYIIRGANNSNQELVDRLLNDKEINNELVFDSDYFAILDERENNYDIIKNNFKFLQSHNLEQEVSAGKLDLYLIGAKYDPDFKISELKLNSKLKPLFDEADKAGVVPRLQDTDLENSKVQAIKEALKKAPFTKEENNNYFIWRADAYIDSNDKLEFFNEIIKNSDRFSDPIRATLNLIDEFKHDPKTSLENLKNISKNTNGMLDDFVWKIIDVK